MELILPHTTLSLWPAGIMLVAAALIVLWRRGRSPLYLLGAAAFGLYLLVLADLTLFPIPIEPNPTGESYIQQMIRYPWRSSTINLIPFTRTDTSGLVLNILLTIPFGAGVALLTRIRRIGWVAPAVGLGIEGMQLAISVIIATAYRSIDINDVLMNALGVLIGYAAGKAAVATKEHTTHD